MQIPCVEEPETHQNPRMPRPESFHASRPVLAPRGLISHHIADADGTSDHRRRNGRTRRTEWFQPSACRALRWLRTCTQPPASALTRRPYAALDGTPRSPADMPVLDQSHWPLILARMAPNFGSFCAEGCWRMSTSSPRTVAT